MSKYIVIIDNYAGAGYLPDDEPAEFDNLEDAVNYIHGEITFTVQTLLDDWNDRDIPALETIVKSVQNDGRFIDRIGNVEHYIAEVV